MTATDHTRLPDAVVRGSAPSGTEDPTVAIPVVPAQYRPVGDPYGPPAGLGHVTNGQAYGPPAGLGHVAPGQVYSPPFSAPGFPPAGPPAGHGPASRKGLFVGGIAAGVAVAGLVIGVAAAAAASTMDVDGTFNLTDSGSSYYDGSSFTPGRSCTGDGGYSDIHSGTAVTVSDASGRVVATGALAGGVASTSSTCEFTFAVPDVPAGEDFYRLEISHRGTLTYDVDELAAGPVVSLGD